LKGDTKLRIAFFMITALEHGGGLETYYMSTASYMRRKMDIQADILTMSDDYTHRVIKALSVFYWKKIDLSLSYKLNLKQIRKLLDPAHYIKLSSVREAKRVLNGYSIVYSKNEVLEAFFFKFFIGYNNIPPVIFGGHTPLRFLKADTLYARLHNFLYTSFIYKFLASGVSAFHALNESEADLYKKLFPRKKVFRVPNPFDFETYRAKATLGNYVLSPSEKFKILWVGRFTEQKGVHQLIRLVSAMVDKQDAIEWHIVGDGEYKAELTALARQYSNVFLHGFVSSEVMPQVYKAADLFISTSQWEGYPYVLLEARAMGLPIIANEIPGVSDILQSYPMSFRATDETSMERKLRVWTVRSRITDTEKNDEFSPSAVYEMLLKEFESIS